MDTSNNNGGNGTASNLNQNANPASENNANNEDAMSSSSGILTEHMSPTPSDLSLSSQSFDPYDVDNYKILHSGAMSCRGRNIVNILAERSVAGMIGGRRRGAAPREEQDKMEEEADGRQDSDPTDIASPTPGTPIIIGTPPNNLDNSQAYVCYLSPPPHRTNRQQQSPMNDAARPLNNLSTAQASKPKLPKPHQLSHDNNNTSILARLTSHIEYSSATRFKASYLKHLGGNTSERVPTSPHVPNQRGMTREQLETQELLRQHLRQEGRDLPGRDFPRRMLNPLQRRDNAGAPAGAGGRFAQLPTQRPPNPNPSVSTISVSFSPDGRTLASTHGDHTVKITCAHTGSLIRNLEGHPRTPWTVKYHPTNNRIVASGCLGFQVRVWDWNYRTESVRRSYRREKERRYARRYCMQEELGRWSPRGVMDPAFRGRRKEHKEEEDDDYAVSALVEMGIPPSDPAWYDVFSESHNYHDGIGICLNMIRLNHAIISLAFHPSGEILAVASGSTLHLWDYDEEGRRRRKKRRESQNLSEQPQPRESESRILYRDRNSDFPASRTVDVRHESALRCVHFPPCGKTLIIGGVNPQSANEGLVHRHPRGRGGMSGGGLSFHLRLWDFDLEAVLDTDGGNNGSILGGTVTDEGEVTWNFSGAKKPLSDPRIIIPRVLLYNDGGFDLSQDGKILSACAEYWLPEGIDSAMELLYSQQEMDDEKEEMPTPQQAQDSRSRSPSVEATGLSYTSPSPIRPSFSILSDPRTPPPNHNFTSLEPPPPPGNRNLPRVYNPNNPNGSGPNLINTTHNPHPLSMVAPSHPAYENDGGRYVPHIVTISMDTSPPIKESEFKIDLTRSIIEMESMRRNPKLGQLLNAAPLDGTKASGVTCVKLSPSAEYCLLGYGVRENLPSVDGNDPRHPVTALYNVNKGMVHVSTLTSIEDDVNIARFHPESGHGFVYGTKQGRVRVLSTRPWNLYEK